ncbi:MULTISPECIES: ribosomal maturation YjgA family protein [Variovorax]
MGAMIRGMRWRFDPLCLAWAMALFLVLILLATIGALWGWLRSFFGDVLAVAWVYLVFKTFVAARVLPVGLAALGVGLAVELGQFLASAWHLHISNRALRIVLGSTADWWDVLAYVIGFAAVLAIEALREALRAARPTASAPRSSTPSR